MLFLRNFLVIEVDKTSKETSRGCKITECQIHRVKISDYGTDSSKRPNFTLNLRASSPEISIDTEVLNNYHHHVTFMELGHLLVFIQT